MTARRFRWMEPLGGSDKVCRAHAKNQTYCSCEQRRFVNKESIETKAGDEIWIPAGATHRLASCGPAMRVLETAFGNWQQADIRRYEDDYQRPAEGEGN